MIVHDLANRLLDYAAVGDRAGYAKERDRQRSERTEDQALDAERLARMQIKAWRFHRHFAWRTEWRRNENAQDNNP